MIVVDASVVIAYLDGADALHGRGEQAMLAHAQARTLISTTTLAEVLVGPARRGEAERIRALLEGVGVEPVPLNAPDAVALAELRAATRLPMPDCCVLLVARARSAAVLSFDEQLQSAAEAQGLAVAVEQ